MTRNGITGMNLGLFTDSKSWLTKFETLNPKDDIETAVFASVNSLASFNNVSIYHVKSHRDIILNNI